MPNYFGWSNNIRNTLFVEVKNLDCLYYDASMFIIPVEMKKEDGGFSDQT